MHTTYSTPSQQSSKILENKIQAYICSNHISSTCCLSLSSSLTQHGVQLARLGGYNNFNYRLYIEKKSYFLKIANTHADILGSSLENDVYCRSQACAYGLSPKIIDFSPLDGILLTDFIETRTGGLDFKEPNAIERYVELLDKVHSLPIEFPRKFCPIDAIQEYILHAQNRGVKLPQALFEKAVPIILSFSKEDLFRKSVPCHLDPQVDNVLDTGNELYLIDWEFAGMCDPYFDLASMCASEQFTDGEMKDLLTHYLKKAPSNDEYSRLYRMRILADLRWALFCFLYTTLSISNTSMYQDFAEGFFERALQRLEI